MFASFNRFDIKLTRSQAKTGSHSGACDDDIAYLLTLPAIKRQLAKISDIDLVAELSEYGAWDNEQLAVRADNEARILWIACGNIVEGN